MSSMVQGDAYSLAVTVKNNGQAVEIDDIEKIEMTLLYLQKYYPKPLPHSILSVLRFPAACYLNHYKRLWLRWYGCSMALPGLSCICSDYALTYEERTPSVKMNYVPSLMRLIR